MENVVKTGQEWEDKDKTNAFDGVARRFTITSIDNAVAVIKNVNGRIPGAKRKIKLSRFVPRRYTLVKEAVHSIPSSGTAQPANV